MTQHHEPGSLRHRLDDAVTRAWSLSQTLELMVPHRSQGRSDEASHGPRRTGSAPPWHAQAAYLVLDLHAEARRLEADLVAQVTGTVKVRGGSTDNTRHALAAVLSLVEAVRDDEVVVVLASLATWTRRAEVALGEAEAPRRLPVNPGEREPRCPNCAYLTLRWTPARSCVFCVNPGCHNEDGDRSTWPITVDHLTGGLQIEWEA